MKKVLFLAIAAISLFASCEKTKETQTTFKTSEKLEAANVKVKTVEERDVPQLVEFTATVQANKVQNIAPQAPVRIRKINVEVGSHVKANQVLVELDETSLTNIKLQMENARVELERLQKLVAAGGASQSNLDAALTQYNVLKGNYENLVENTVLRSPVDGIVTARNYDAGNLYNGQQPVLVVQQMAPVKILLDVNEQYYKDVAVGMPIENITLDAYPGETFSGVVSIVYPTISQATRSFQVEVKIDNRNERVRPGMFARVTLNFGDAKHVLVPDQAVVKQTGSGERFVYVADGNHAFHKTIELGRRIGDMYEVVSGLSDGDVVVVFGQTVLTDGREINILK